MQIIENEDSRRQEDAGHLRRLILMSNIIIARRKWLFHQMKANPMKVTRTSCSSSSPLPSTEMKFSSVLRLMLDYPGVVAFTLITSRAS